ncbi:putative DNA helicase ino80 [Lecanora helva]
MPLPSTISPRLGPPPSPKINGPSRNGSIYSDVEPGRSTRYDPISEHREGQPSWRQSPYPSRSPKETREIIPYSNNHYNEPKTSPIVYQSPTGLHFPQASPKFATHAHPPSRRGSFPQSPARNPVESPIHRPDGLSYTSHMNGSIEPFSSQGTIDEEKPEPRPTASVEPKPTRTKDPMAFSSILASTEPDPPANAPRSTSTSKHHKLSPHHLNGDTQQPTKSSRRGAPELLSTSTESSGQVMRHVKSEPDPPPLPKSLGNYKAKPGLTSDKENEKVRKEMARIDTMDMSDLELPEFEAAKQRHIQASLKRQQAVEATEDLKRKRRRITAAKTLSILLGTHADHGRSRFRGLYENSALHEVQQKEVQDEKDRKKDMQRKRRREKTLQTQKELKDHALKKLEIVDDQEERVRLQRELHKASKKMNSTKRILENGGTPEEIREVTPLAPNLEGGTMGSFPSGSAISPEPPRKKMKGSTVRPKKSKEKKQAEKDAAEAGWAAGWVGTQRDADDHVLIAPKEENRRETLVRETKDTKPSRDNAKEVSPVAPVVTNYASKGYTQMYEQIWKEIARKDVPKVYRIKENSLSTKQSNLRKTAQLASKEARRWQLRTNKGTKDVQARAKRSMREMMSFWKRNERAERDMRKVAEKQELENARKAEADRESNRQKRKLNFLISQTELYSHFIGKKVKTDEVERSTDSAEVAISSEVITPGKADAHTITLPDSAGQPGMKVTNFDQLDFDNEDESSLRAAATANAQHAIQEAQDKAREFNRENDDLQAQFDNGEMNFQNPTGIDSMDVAQPKMLNAQLKEYQLKGLSWLVNLYEQGINGILADEMGLGKTIQSISVMAYLAEKHNIWGPFLVVAPASTLHNWQQEITRFIPDLKCLPYWGNAKDRKVLRKFWDRKHIIYNKDSSFHVLITSYQLVVQDTQYFQKIRWQYMMLDEAQAIKSSQSSRWKSLLGFHCRNRLLLTGTPIQNNMQELWALLHFIMPTLFDSHDEFSEWFSKDIESHAQSNTKLNEDQLKRLHMILKPFMLRRVKSMVQKELGDKIEEDVFCDLTYRQRAYYLNLRNRISIMDLIEKAAVGDDQDTATLMNLVMQFRKVCNHPDLFERAETSSPYALAHFAETASFLREGNNVNVAYSTRNLIEYDLPRLLCSPEARLDVAGPGNTKAGFNGKYLAQLMNIWTPENIRRSMSEKSAFSWMRFADTSPSEAYAASHRGLGERAINAVGSRSRLPTFNVIYDEHDEVNYTPSHALFNIAQCNDRYPLSGITEEGRLRNLLNVSKNVFEAQGLNVIERCARPGASAPPIQIACSDQDSRIEKENTIFNVHLRKALYGVSEKTEAALLEAKVNPSNYPTHDLLPQPLSQKARYTSIHVPSMRRFVSDSGKLAKLDELLRQLKEGGHRVLLYFQMTRMIDLMEEYLTYRNYKYVRLDGSTKLEDRRDTVGDFQTKPEIFVFLLSTRAGGLGINLTAADTVIFYDSDWNPTIDSQAMDRAHRLGQTRQVTVYRMITRGTIEERIRKRALQKEEVQRVVISGGSGAGVDFNTRSKENRNKDIALWLADDDQAELIEKKEQEIAAKTEEGGKKGGRKKTGGGRKKEINLDDMYHEGEGHFDDGSNKPSGAATPMEFPEPAAPGGKRKGISKKAKTAKQRLAIADGSGA